MEEKILEIVTQNAVMLGRLSEKVDRNAELIAQNTIEIAKNREIIENHENRIDSIEKYLIVIEDAVTNKIPALFDKTSWQDE